MEQVRCHGCMCRQHLLSYVPFVDDGNGRTLERLGNGPEGVVATVENLDGALEFGQEVIESPRLGRHVLCECNVCEHIKHLHATQNFGLSVEEEGFLAWNAAPEFR